MPTEDYNVPMQGHALGLLAVRPSGRGSVSVPLGVYGFAVSSSLTYP